MRFRVLQLLILSALAALFVWGAGQELEMTIPDPDRYRDSGDYLYREGALQLGVIGALFALCALYVLARIIRRRRSWRLPLSALALIPVMVASALPYEGWIDAHGFFDSFGYLINALLIEVAAIVTWLVVRSLIRERDGQLHALGPLDDPLDLILMTIVLIVAVIYGVSIEIGLLATATALLTWRAMRREYRRVRHRSRHALR